MAATTHPLCVAILNDYDLVVHGVAGLLAPHADRVSFAGRYDPDTRLSVDVVLFDALAQPTGDKGDIKTIRTRTGAKVLVYTWPTGISEPAHHLARGASGFVWKSATGAQLLHAIEQAHAGRTDQPPRLSKPDPDVWPGMEHGLTRREAQVLAHVTRGASNQEIADACYLSINSVKTYVRTGYRKIGVSRRADAVRWAVEHGLA